MTDSTRSFTINTAPQRSDEWFQARLGRLTGSRASDMLATVQKGEAAGRRNLRTQLVLERLTGRPPETTFTSPAMQQGIDREEAARAAYEQLTGSKLVTTGFVSHNNLMVGCSLDGHVGDFDSLIEIKCPMPATHLAYLRSGAEIPFNYMVQINHALWITGAESCDFVSYNPDFPTKLQLRRTTVWRDDTWIQGYEAKVLQFLAECDAELASVERLAA